MKILLVETDENAIQGLKPLLRLGHKIFVCKNGNNALLVLEKETFDLLMVDVDLVEVGGIEFLAALRRKEKTTGKHLPVVALGSLPESGRIPGMDIGFNHDLRKPIQQQKILELLDKLTGENTPNVIQKPPINEKAGLALCDNDEELFFEILQIFLTDASALLEKLENALKNNDATLAERHAHALKGAAGNICAEPFKEIVTQIERAARSGDPASANPLYTKLSSEFNRLRAYAEKILPSKK